MNLSSSRSVPYISPSHTPVSHCLWHKLVWVRPCGVPQVWGKGTFLAAPFLVIYGHWLLINFALYSACRVALPVLRSSWWEHCNMQQTKLVMCQAVFPLLFRFPPSCVAAQKAKSVGFGADSGVQTMGLLLLWHWQGASFLIYSSSKYRVSTMCQPLFLAVGIC